MGEAAEEDVGRGERLGAFESKIGETAEMGVRPGEGLSREALGRRLVDRDALVPE
jgi:hypothetical protein